MTDPTPSNARNRFEDFPALAKWMQRLANTDCGMNGYEWNDFCQAVNAALPTRTPAPELADGLEVALQDAVRVLHACLSSVKIVHAESARTVRACDNAQKQAREIITAYQRSKI